MSIAPWVLPVLWREHDWRAAIERLGKQLAGADNQQQAQRAAVELGRASEYIDPDRRRAIALYELAGAGGVDRARELALELGWWSARARLTLAARARGEADPRLVLEEAEAWWDADQPDLCALALAGLRAEHGVHAGELGALMGGEDLQDHVADAVARAVTSTGAEAAEAYVMAARFSRAAGRTGDVTRWLESALTAHPSHATAAAFLLMLARQSRDPELLKRYLQLRLESTDVTEWVDRMRACAFALIESDHHRGFGLRLLRHALERGYESGHANIPGHLAMWTVLAAHAAADGTRRELLPLVITALQSSPREVDRVWLGVLATEISLRDANHPVVAGAYAEIVAEHAPDHPIVRELVAMVAITQPEPATASTKQATAPIPVVPAAAVTAAAAQLEESFDVDVDLDDAYAEAAEASMFEAMLEDDLELEDEIFPVRAAEQPAVIARPVASAPSAKLPSAHTASDVKPATTSRSSTVPSTAGRLPTAATSSGTKPSAGAAKPLATPSEIRPEARSRSKPSVAPASIAKPATAVKPASIVPASMKTSSIIPTSLGKPAAISQPYSITKPASKITGAMQPIARTPPVARSSSPGVVLAALRTPNRPVIPPRAADPPDAAPRARRIAMPIDICMIRADKTRIDGHSRDVSTSGLFVLTDAKLAVNDELTLELRLPGKEAFTEDEFRSRARVARRAEGGYGLELVSPEAALIAALSALR